MNDRTKENIKMFGVMIAGILILISMLWTVSYLTYQMFGSYDFVLTAMAIGVCITIPIVCVLIYLQEKGIKKHKNPEVIV